MNKWGNLIGKITASFNASLAASRPATSSQRMLGLSTRIALVRPARSFFTSGSWSPSSSSFLKFRAHCVVGNIQQRVGVGTHFLPSPPGPPFAIPFAPIARRARFSPTCDRCSLSCSARPRYSAILALIRVFDRSFFSSTRSIPVSYWDYNTVGGRTDKHLSASMK